MENKLLLSLVIWHLGFLSPAAPADTTSPPRDISTRRENTAAATPETLNSSLTLVHTQSMYINYQIQGIPASDINRVELWYAQGRQGPWRFYDYDSDKKSPVLFTAPAEGIYRLLVVALDRWGRRSCRTGKGQKPGQGMIPNDVTAHLVVRIGYIMPQLYLRSPYGELPSYRRRQLKISWVGFDTDLPTNPVDLYYQSQGMEQWKLLASALPAKGQYLWEFPRELTGKTTLKAVLTDHVGNCDVKYSAPIDIVGNDGNHAPVPGSAPRNLSESKKISKNTVSPPKKSTDIHSKQIKLSKSAEKNQYSKMIPALKTTTSLSPVLPMKTAISSHRNQLDKILRRGDLYSMRQEWDRAARAYQQALDLDPGYSQARINLADMYYKMGKFKQAQEQFQFCLKEDPSSQSALLYSLAQTQINMNQFKKARQTLEKLVQYDSRDYQGWLMLGDVARKMGEYKQAKEFWRQAARSNIPAIAHIALQRLDED